MKPALRERMTRKGKVLVPGHFVLSSGLHSLWYINKDDFYTDTHALWEACALMARAFRADSIQTVIGPAVGAVRLSMGVAYHLEEFSGRSVKSIHADKCDGEFVIKRGHSRHLNGRRVLVVEDTLSTGEATRKVVRLVRDLGGIVGGVASLYNRGDVTARHVGDVPRLESLLYVTLPTWSAQECPACAAGTPTDTQFQK